MHVEDSRVINQPPAYAIPMSQPQLPRLEGVEHHFVELPGLRMHVAEAGSGTPVLQQHGFPQHWWEWRKVIPGLAERFRVICPNLCGAGWTDAPRRGYTRDQLLADVVALLDTLGLDGVHLLTHDYGALVGYQLCLRHPERVRHHLSLGIPPPYFGFDPRMVLALVRRAWFNLLIPVPVLGPRLLGCGRQRLPRRMLSDFSSAREAFAAEDVELFAGRLREPSRARAGSALYCHFIQPETVRIMTVSYRGRRWCHGGRRNIKHKVEALNPALWKTGTREGLGGASGATGYLLSSKKRGRKGLCSGHVFSAS
jgi:pimeloyl-ACP methyl ester carboxylesterase